MKAKLNNSILEEVYNISTPGKCLFVQKWSEMFHHQTINTYTFRLRNTRTMIKEAKDTLVEVKQGVVKASNLHDLILECRKYLEKDICFKQHYPHLHTVLLKELKYKSDNKSELVHLEHRLNNALSSISTSYKVHVIEDLEVAIEQSDLKKVEQLSELLASELISSGWSPRSLSRLLQIHFLGINRLPPFEEKWSNFIAELNKEPKNFKCYFKLSSSELEHTGSLEASELKIVLGNKIIEEFSNARRHVQADAYYLLEETKAFSEDIHMAVEEARHQLAIKQSVLSYFDIPLENFAYVLVGFPNQRMTNYELRNEHDLQEESIDQDIRTVMTVLNKGYFSLEDKQRLINFFRQYDLSIQATSLETRYTNLWSSLESLLVSGHHNSKIEHIKKIVPAILCSNYAYRLLVNFLQDCSRADVRPKYNDRIIETSDQDAVELLLKLVTENGPSRNAFQSSLNDYTLLEQRFIELSNDFSNSKTYHDLISNHFDTVSWHLQRLYRARNKLVHAAISEKDTALLINHLNFYIMSTVHEFIHRLEKNEFQNFGDLYLAIEDNHLALSEALQQNIKNSPRGKFISYDPDLIFHGPIFKYL
ncbi:hypothetical protein [Planococcus lenghuensis]|uniref:Apea-like HEPN domain-containing protein n=1 Tax=Planococcus lenghuensis TaxID=2213202 RepID=A0A1Q2L5A7_9BACL|nr:hypothetical protein [Planococcus lenghuensis]AQQ55277.1 hypothetical protein B0X71_19035 [Planococcus lenghuensis]